MRWKSDAIHRLTHEQENALPQAQELSRLMVMLSIIAGVCGVTCIILVTR